MVTLADFNEWPKQDDTKLIKLIRQLIPQPARETEDEEHYLCTNQCDDVESNQ